MAAFQKIESGISEMDKALNHIRMGDNVVWQIDSLEVFKAFVNPFVTQAIADKRNLIYIRFSEHEPLLEPQPGFVTRNLLSHDFETERMFRERGQRRDIFYISCDGLTRNSDFTSMMEKILHTLQTVYDYPVDIEYTVNIGENNDFVMNLLQCRPLQTWQDSQTVDIPVYKDNSRVLFDIKQTAMGRSRKENIDVIVFQRYAMMQKN